MRSTGGQRRSTRGLYSQLVLGSQESTYYRVALKFVSSSGSDSELRRSGINGLAGIDQVIVSTEYLIF